ncbi:permease [Pelagibacterium montanilacus]|uniref:permease n=1 Tax=Pelagibacterium montanilacus TaxID=2185280 RepID=UPI000F8C6865|nr:permease [Pelagibacterium montanilacus]
MSDTKSKAGFRFTRTDMVFTGLALVSGLACLVVAGQDAFMRAVAGLVELALMVLPQLAAGLLIGGLIQHLVSRESIARVLGSQSGWRGLVLASGIGMVCPGGPFTSFPLVHALWLAGADASVLVSFLTAWTVIGLNRLLVWEIPFMGTDFAVLRFIVSLPLPLLSGLIARWLLAKSIMRFEPSSQNGARS